MAWVAAPVNASRCLQQWRGVELAPARHSLLACLSGIAFICRAMSTPTRLQARRDEFSASVDSRRRSYMQMHGCPEPWSLSQSTMHRQDKKWKTKHTPILFCVCVRMCVCGFEREKTRQSVCCWKNWRRGKHLDRQTLMLRQKQTASTPAPHLYPSRSWRDPLYEKQGVTGSQEVVY